jgi:hypothetical protein
MSRQRKARMAPAACAGGAGILLAIVLSACASTTASLPPTVTQQARDTPAQSRDDEPGGLKAVANRNPLDRPNSAVVHVQGRHVGGNEGATSAGNYTAVNPCSLVSRSEAQSIAGGAVTGVSEAPLGPTCVYAVAHQAAITVAIQSATLSSVTAPVQGRRRITVAGRAGYCGSLGHQVLYVRANAHNVLNIGAPCAVAQRIAVKALASLPQ